MSKEPKTKPSVPQQRPHSPHRLQEFVVLYHHYLRSRSFCLLVKPLQAHGLHLPATCRAGLAILVGEVSLFADHLRKGKAAGEKQLIDSPFHQRFAHLSHAVGCSFSFEHRLLKSLSQMDLNRSFQPFNHSEIKPALQILHHRGEEGLYRTAAKTVVAHLAPASFLVLVHEIYRYLFLFHQDIGANNK